MLLAWINHPWKVIKSQMPKSVKNHNPILVKISNFSSYEWYFPTFWRPRSVKASHRGAVLLKMWYLIVFQSLHIRLSFGESIQFIRRRFLMATINKKLRKILVENLQNFLQVKRPIALVELHNFPKHRLLKKIEWYI